MKETLSRWFPRYAVKNLSYLFSGNFFSYLLGFLYGIFAARILGPADFGQLVSVIALVKLAVIPFDLRIGQPLVKLLGGTEDPERRRKISGSVLIVHWSMLAAFAFFFLITLLLLPEFWSIFRDWQISLALYAASEIMLQARLVGPFLNTFEHYGSFSAYKTLVSFFRNVIPVPFMVLGVQETCFGYFLAEVLLVLVTMIGFTIQSPFSLSSLLNLSRRDLWNVLREVYQHSRSNYLANVLKKSFGRSQELIIRQFVGAAEVGYFNIGMKFNKIFLFSSKTLRTYLYPRLVEKWENRKDEFFYTLRKYFYQGSIFYSGLTIAVCFGAVWLIPYFYGVAYQPALIVTWIVVPPVALTHLFNLSRATFFSANRHRVILNVNVLKAGLGLPLLFWLVVEGSYVGVAVGVALTEVIKVLYLVFEYRRAFGWRWIVPARAGDEE